ncbi:MAG: hypothetical protein ACOC0R_02810 [Mariniphaga sp.]
MLNVTINAVHCTDKQFVDEACKKAGSFSQSGKEKLAEIIKITEEKISSLK